MKRVLAATLAGILLAACSDRGDGLLAPAGPAASVTASGIARVTTASDAGPGSFRQAVLEASADPSIRRIDFAPRVGTIVLQSPVVYSGAQALEIHAKGVTLDGAALAAGDAFTANGGANLEIRDLVVRNAPGIGITVAVPGDAAGTIRVSLVDVRVTGSGSHGVLINDQAEYFADPNSTSPAGSDASLDVRVVRGVFADNGFSALDRDGLRINEGGAGDLRAEIDATRVTGNGGDGVELDERGAGDVVFAVSHSALDENGSFSADDYDDGIDVDESGEGSIAGTVRGTTASRNFEQGFDLNENDAGDLRVDMTGVEAIGNREEGIEYEEDDDFAGGGDIVARLVQVTARDNGAADGDAGLKLREKGAGSLDATLIGVESTDNHVDGVLLREDAAGGLAAEIENFRTMGNAGDGIEFDENSSGDLTATLTRAVSSDNTGTGVRADQASPGVGTLLLTAVRTSGNGAGEVIANAGVTVTQAP